MMNKSGLYRRVSAFFLTSSLVLGACSRGLEAKIEPDISPVPHVQTAIYTPEPTSTLKPTEILPTPTVETNNEFELDENEFYFIDEYWYVYNLEENIPGCIVLLSVNDENQIEYKQVLLQELERIDSIAWQDDSIDFFLDSKTNYLNDIQEIDESISDEEYITALSGLFGTYMKEAIQEIYGVNGSNPEIDFYRVLPYIDSTVEDLIEFSSEDNRVEQRKIFSESIFFIENVVNLVSAPVLDEYYTIGEGAVSREFLIKDMGVCDTLYVGDYSKILPQGAIPYDESYDFLQGQDA